jgi:hypothetical protein
MKRRSFVAVADSHAGEINPRVEKALKGFMKDFRPQVRIHLGDAWDLRALRDGADEHDREASIEEDFDHAERFLASFFDGGQENYYLEGNHDRVRVERFAVSRQSLVREAAIKGLDEMNRIQRRCRCRVLPYDARKGVLQLGHLRAVHGYACGRNATTVHARLYGNVIHGHTHTIEVVPIENIDGASEARAIGALCNIDQPYNGRQPNKLRHANGWAYGYLYEDGTYHLMQVREINGVFRAALDLRDY